MLRIGRQDLVSRTQAEPGDDDVNGAGRRVRERDVERRDSDLVGDRGTDPLTAFERLIEVRLAASTVDRLPCL